MPDPSPDPSRMILLALGANLPFDGRAPAETLQAALAALAAEGLGPLRVSRAFATPCFPPGAGPDYVNAAAALPLPSNRGPAEILALLHEIESRFGRTRETRWGMRTLDLDLIAHGGAHLPDPETHRQWRDLPPDRQRSETPDRLILPHPRLQDRAFVLIPLLDIAPEWAHPATGLTIAQMAAALPPAARAEPRPLPTGFNACQ